MDCSENKDELIRKLRAREKWSQVDAAMNEFLRGAMAVVEDNIVIEDGKAKTKPELFEATLEDLQKKGIIKAENITFMVYVQKGNEEYLEVVASTKKTTREMQPMKGQRCSNDTFAIFKNSDFGKVKVLKTEEEDKKKAQRYNGKSYLFDIVDVDNPEKARYALMGLANLQEGYMKQEYIRLFEKMGLALGRQIGRVVERSKYDLELRKTLEQLAKAVEQKDLLVTSFQHDVGNILTFIKNNVTLIHDVLSRIPLNDIDELFNKHTDFSANEILEMLKDTQINTDGIADLTQEILSLVELIKTGTIEPQYILIQDAREIILTVVDRVNYLAKDKKITIAVCIPKNSKLYADQGLLKSILDNLLRNAIKFCDEGDKIRVTLDSESADTTIIVRDTGRGIDTERIEKLFDFEANTSTAGTRNEKGKGRGLPNTKRLVEAHKGANLKVQSRVGKGTTFWIHFPLPVDIDSTEKQFVHEDNFLNLDFG